MALYYCSDLLITLIIVKIAFFIHPMVGILVEGILIYFCLSAKGLKVEGLKVIKTLESGDIEKRVINYHILSDVTRHHLMKLQLFVQ